MSVTPVPRPRRTVRPWAVVAGGLALMLAAVGVVLGPRAIESWVPDTTVGLTVVPPEPTELPSPFAGTPAEHFAEGADGIVLPPAEAIDPFTAEEIADALEQVKAALIAARLDPTMLVDHNPDPFLSLLAPDAQVARLRLFDTGDFRAFASQVADDAQLGLVSPRVDGRILYRSTPAAPLEPSVVEIETHFVWVYAFDSDHLVVVRDELTWEMKYGLPWTEATQGLWLLLTATSHVWGADCEGYESGLLAPAPGALADAGEELGVIFDPAAPLDSDEGCSGPDLIG